MNEVDHEAIMVAEDLSRLVKTPEWAHYENHKKEMREMHSRALLSLGRKKMEPGVAEFYAHRLAALDELEEWIEETIARGIRERTRFVEAEATERPSDGPAPIGQQENT